MTDPSGNTSDPVREMAERLLAALRVPYGDHASVIYSREVGFTVYFVGRGCVVPERWEGHEVTVRRDCGPTQPQRVA